MNSSSKLLCYYTDWTLQAVVADFITERRCCCCCYLLPRHPVKTHHTLASLSHASNTLYRKGYVFYSTSRIFSGKYPKLTAKFTYWPLPSSPLPSFHKDLSPSISIPVLVMLFVCIYDSSNSINSVILCAKCPVKLRFLKLVCGFFFMWDNLCYVYDSSRVQGNNKVHIITNGCVRAPKILSL